MGRICAVPHCYTGYRKCTDKVSLYKVPEDDFFLAKWQEAIAREDRPITPKDYVCGKHFKEDDILRRRIIKDVVEEYQRPKLKQDAIPSIFPDLPEYILKMTKKRRKMTSIAIPNQTADISLAETYENKICNIKNEPEVNIQESGHELEGEINTDEIDIKTEVEEVPSSVEDEIIEEYDSSGAKLYHCDECNYKTKFAHNLRTHKIKHLSGDNAFMSCELCINYKTKWEVTYVNHMKSKHGIVLKEIWKCPFCLFKTKNKSFLSKHCDKEHSNKDLETKFNCEYEGCDYQTESKALLNIHSLTHDIPKSQEFNKIRTYSCQECYFMSNSKGSLATHNKSAHNVGPKHTVDKTIKGQTKLNISKKKTKQYFNCSRCPYRSHSQVLLDKHLIKHSMASNKSLLSCNKCKYTTTCEVTFNNHRKDTFHCVQCPFTSAYKSEYLKHIITHRDSLTPPFSTNEIALDEEMTPVQDFSLVIIKEEHVDEFAVDT